MKSKILCALVSTFVAQVGARAQTLFPEIEPNDRKVSATFVHCLDPGDILTGISTGSATFSGAVDSADYFLLKTCPTTPGIYCHRLVVTTPGGVGHSCTLRSMVQTNGIVDPAADVNLQQSHVPNGYERFNSWYAFGKGERIFYRVDGTEATTQPYEVRFVTEAVTPVTVPGTFTEGAITITTEGLGHATDTELWVYDEEFVAIPDFGNDDTPGALGAQSTLTRTYSAGVYYIALSNYDLANEYTAPPDDGYQNGFVLDFRNALVDGPSVTAVPLTMRFKVVDANGSTTVDATKTGVFDVLWFKITVAAAGTSVSTHCHGDGSATPCPCGNTGALGHGCGHSLNPAGAHLDGVGLASVSADTFQLVGNGMPNNYALYFEGTALMNGGLGIVFGDGLRCIGGSMWRLGVKINVAGASVYPGVGEVPISIRGHVPASGGWRTYQVWYRNASPTFCNPQTFNLSNAAAVTWLP